MSAVRELAPEGKFKWDGSWFGHPGIILIDHYAGTPLLREKLSAGAAWQTVVHMFGGDEAAFRQTRRRYMLYPDTTWANVDHILEQAVADRAFPGAVAMVADRSGVRYQHAVGHHTYDAGSPPMSPATVFDLASLTKVVATTTASMLLFQWGELPLDLRLVQLFGSSFVAADPRKANITVLHLLTHTAGLPPDPTPSSFCTPSFACPETALPPSQREATPHPNLTQRSPHGVGRRFPHCASCCGGPTRSFGHAHAS